MGQMQQHDQDNRRGLGLVRYVIWKSDTKLAAWKSLDIGIHSDSSPMSSYSSQITLYRSLHACQRLIFESTIWEISYLGFLSIITGAGAGCILSEKVLDVVGSHGRLDEQSIWTLEDGEWTIEYQAGQWFHRIRDIFWRVSLKAGWFRRTEPWQKLYHLLWNQEQGNVAHQWISDSTVGPQRFQLWGYSVIHWDLWRSRGLWRKQYCVQGEQWCLDDIPY